MTQARRDARPETQIYRPFPLDPPAEISENPDNPQEQIVLFDESAPLTDDTPTVISKNQPKPAATEDLSAGNLRGRRLAHFELIDQIGVGGMAAVLRARDTQLDRIVALKILPPSLAQDLENVRRFHQEARSAARLDHENIARVFYCNEDQGLHFIAFEYVEGEDLRAILERVGRLPVHKALNYVLQAAAGLAHAAQRGVVHRDIKPSNIVITPHGRAKLVDMGLARSLDPRKDPQLTQSGVTLGTFDYISPEQALEPREADVRSDIYSLGCTFYHMVTGQPPVPEGTAAKKLQHHQNVKPIDPRQLAPDLPDEVAQILDRMMAKRPQDRYQTPEQLMQHLLQAARRLGASADVPEGVLTFETSLPNPPTSRSMLLGVLAVAAVIALVVVLEPSSRVEPPDQPPLVRVVEKGEIDAPPLVPTPVAAKDKNGQPPSVPDEPPPLAASSARFDSEQVTSELLAQWAAEHRGKDRLEIELSRDVDLFRDDGVDPGIVVQARKTIVLRSKDRTRRPTIRLSYPGAAKQSPWAALTLEAESVQVEGVRILIDGAEAPGVEMIGLWLRGGSRHRIERCDFFQTQPPRDRGRMMSVVVEAFRGQRVAPQVRLNECTFLGWRSVMSERAAPGLEPNVLMLNGLEDGAREAVVRRGPVPIEAVNCAFGPHAAVFQLERPEEAAVRVEHCTFLAGSQTSVFQLGAAAAADIRLSHCLVARAGDSSTVDRSEIADDGSALIRQSEVRGPVAFTGEDNRYYRLDAYWVGAETRASEWLDFKRLCDPAPSMELTEYPWRAERPLVESFRLSVQFDPTRPPSDDRGRKRDEERRLADTFRVKDRVAALRTSTAGEEGLIGIQRLQGLPLVASLPPLEEKRPDPIVAGRDRIVDPDLEKEDPTNGLYRSLEQAVVAARPGEVIRIRKNGLIALDPIKLKKFAGTLTLQPYPEFRPVLVMGEPAEREPAMFTLYDGQLRIEGLELRLRPGRTGFKSQAIVALHGGDLSLRDCVVSLDRGSRDTVLAVALLPDAGSMMMVKPPATSPQLSLENCIVRGEGDLLLGRNGGPFKIDARNVLAALTGSFIQIQAEAEPPPVDSVSSVRLDRVTTYLGGQFLRLHAGKDLASLAPITVAPTECLFHAANGRALVQLDGAQARDRTLREKLLWTPGSNVYGNFTDMLNQLSQSAEMAPPPLTQQDWRALTGEMEARFLAVKFAGPLPDEGGSWSRVLPSAFRPSDLAGLGADLDKLRGLLDRADK